MYAIWYNMAHVDHHQIALNPIWTILRKDWIELVQVQGQPIRSIQGRDAFTISPLQSLQLLGEVSRNLSPWEVTWAEQAPLSCPNSSIECQPHTNAAALFLQIRTRVHPTFKHFREVVQGCFSFSSLTKWSWSIGQLTMFGWGRYVEQGSFNLRHSPQQSV